MPSELQKAAEKKRKTVSSAKGVKKQKTDVDPNQILSKLEKKEKIESDTEDDPSGLCISRKILFLIFIRLLFGLQKRKRWEMMMTIMISTMAGTT